MPPALGRKMADNLYSIKVESHNKHKIIIIIIKENCGITTQQPVMGKFISFYEVKED